MNDDKILITENFEKKNFVQTSVNNESTENLRIGKHSKTKRF